MSQTHTHAAKHEHDDHDNTSEGGCCQGGGSCETEGKKKAGGCCKENGSKSASMGQMTSDLLRPMGWEEMATLPTLHLIMRYRRGVQNIDNRVLQLSERDIDMAFLPEAGVGRWPVRVLVGHLADAEVAAVHRMRRTIGEANPVVSLWDEDSFVDSGIYENGDKEYADSPEGDQARVMSALGGYMAVIHTLRQWTGQWLLTLTDADWQRTFMHPTRGEVSMKQYVAMNTWHVEHHAKFLTMKLDKMGIEHAAPQPKSGGGCGSGCGCG
jgi:DinB superfamily